MTRYERYDRYDDGRGGPAVILIDYPNSRHGGRSAFARHREQDP